MVHATVVEPAMQNRCPHCGASLHQEGDAPAQPALTRCWMCTLPLPQADASLTIVPDSPTIMMRPRNSRGKAAALRLSEAPATQVQALVLPHNEQIRISVIEGTRPGVSYDLSRTLMTIGRIGGGADIEIEDTEVSRIHCSIEVRRDAILLQDLRSTNGTFIDNSRIFAARLDPASQFRVGKTVLRVERTPI